MGLSSKQALAEKAKKWMDPSSANYPKDNHTENKPAWWKTAQEKNVKQLHSEERKEPYNTRNRTNNIVQELSEKQPKGKNNNNTLTRRSPIKVVKNKQSH